MDYLDFFSLSEDPFRLTPDPFYFYPSREHNEILSSLNYAVEQKEGFFLATGEPGTGKTTILKVFINNWKDRAEIALIMTPRLSPEEFLLALIEDLKITLNTTNKNEVIKSFRDFLLEHSSSGRRVIIIVDEAQNLPDETLEELRLLSNLETEKEKLLQIVLIGQPELRTRLLSNSMRQLNQRITLRGVLVPLGMNETSDYVTYRLIKAGKGSVLFEQKARKLLYKRSKGIPRLINLIASRAMMAAYLDVNRNIRKRHIIYATRHLLDETIGRRRWKWPGFFSKPVLASFMSAIAVLAIFLAFGNRIAEMNLPGKGSNSAVPEKPPRIVIDTSSQKPAQKEEPGGLAALHSEAQGTAHNRIIVTVEAANLRAAPSLASEALSAVVRDNSFDVAGESVDAAGKKWYKVRSAEGKECWISAAVVKIITNQEKTITN
ncbi:MAG: AAA family ATPase [Dissulfurispiraceae bacterium]|jgi:general secretion pathway protein A